MENGLPPRKSPEPPKPARENDPYRMFRFRVKMSGGGFLDFGKTTEAAFSQCSGIRASTEVVRVRTGADIRGVQGIIPSIVTYSNLTLSKGVVANGKFLDWVFGCLPTNLMGPKKPKRKTIEISVLNDAGKEGVTWTLYGAYPVGYELASLDASQDGVLMETLEFAYVGLKRST